MRGKLLLIASMSEPVRITPAHAGKTAIFTKGAAEAEDHPRACGENLKMLVFSVAALGSPPRMRGKHVSFFNIFIISRITPAHAGKTR